MREPLRVPRRSPLPMTREPPHPARVRGAVTVDCQGAWRIRNFPNGLLHSTSKMSFVPGSLMPCADELRSCCCRSPSLAVLGWADAQTRLQPPSDIATRGPPPPHLLQSCCCCVY